MSHFVCSIQFKRLLTSLQTVCYDFIRFFREIEFFRQIASFHSSVTLSTECVGAEQNMLLQLATAVKQAGRCFLPASTLYTS